MDLRHSSRAKWSATRGIIVFAVVTGVMPLLAAVTPEAWLRSVADGLGHIDDLSAERLARFRLVGVALSVGHWTLAALLSAAASPVGRMLARLRDELVPIRLWESVRAGARWMIEPGGLHGITLLVILWSGVEFRLKYLSTPMDYDEAYSFLHYARRPIYEGLADYDSTNNHLLNTLWMHVEFRAFGQREWALRLHVFAAGVALIGATYVLGRSMISSEAGLAAAALVAVSDVLVNYSVNARGYIWVAWMTILFLAATRRIADADTGSRAVDWLAAAATAVVGLFAMPIMLYSIAGGLALVALRLRGRGHSPRTIVLSLSVWLMAVGLAAAWLYSGGLIFRGISAWQHPFVLPQVRGLWFSRFPAAWLLAVRSWSEGPVPWFVVAALGAIGFVSMWWLYRRAFWLLASVFAATFLIMAVQRVSPPPRIFSFLAPVFCLVVASGIVAISRLIGDTPGQRGERKSFATPATIACVVAIGLCAWNYNKSRDEPLPGGPRPCFLVEDVDEIHSLGEQETEDDQYWRLEIPELVDLLASEVNHGNGARVLVGLPADLPFHYYAARIGWTAGIGGTPQRGERLLLVARGDDPQKALRENLSLRITDPDPAVLNLAWHVLVQGELTVWLAHWMTAESTDAASP